MTNQLLDPQEAAEVLKMDSRTLVRWARNGYVPAHPLGGGKRKLWRFLEHELLDWVEAQGKPGERRPVASATHESIDIRARKSA
jgi:excisionase family DNA binding protein